MHSKSLIRVEFTTMNDGPVFYELPYPSLPFKNRDAVELVCRRLKEGPHNYWPMGSIIVVSENELVFPSVENLEKV